MTLGAFLFRSSRMWKSRTATSTTFSRLAIPMESAKLRKASGVHPFLLRPDIVGILGSSHPFTYPPSTSFNNFRLLTTVWLRFLLANSLCLGLTLPGRVTWSRNQSYNSRCGANSSVQRLCDTCSI